MKERIIEELMESISASEDAIYGIPGAAARIEQIVLDFNYQTVFALQKRIENLHELMRLKDEMIEHLSAFHDSKQSPAVKVVYSTWNEYYEELLKKIKDKVSE
jgi:hypothetical protein